MSEYREIIVEREVPCTVRDGVTLYANIYRPQGDGQFPVLLSRLPYNKNLPEFSHRYIDPIRIAMNGYVVIIQDVRGRFASEGVFEPYIQELEDGYDTVEWAAKLPYSTGDVGMFGLSYYGFTQLYAALERPPSLKAIFPAQTRSLSRNDLFYRNGVYELAFIETWMLDSIAPDYLKRVGSGNFEETMQEISHDLNNIDEWYKHKPFKKWPPINKHPELAKLVNKYLNQELGNKLLAEKVAENEKRRKIEIPAYHLAGWYDSHLAPTLTNYEEMQSSKNNQKLIIGPWAHGQFDSDIGERFYGVNSSGNSIEGEADITTLHIEWFDHWLKGNNTSLNENDDPVKIFVMGINEWRSEKEWPLKRTVYTPFYFQSDGRANTDMNSGRLLEKPADEVQKDYYIHNPNNPVPSLGGGTLFFKGRNNGPRDQREIEKREDVVVYTSEPLTEPLEVTGWVKVNLWASSDAADTDFTAKLVDVLPDGRAYNLTDGIVRAKYRNGDSEETSLKGEIVQYEIDLWATSNVFLPGHCIRIEIASSNFPRFDVNPGTGDTTLDTVEMIPAKQTIYHGAEYPSHVVLPVIPK
ncbi:CocE/NonD family hydrolase [Sporosarcina jiandibaonis]|uniref:CocE/NonD family hydrolase n=1 Tax=Sporosarcina jiandibaonis TaxID=2715535 RepID=UPI001556F758|nr:CocE/NonD family hydrolase [Sporosarcina jiandibaonis]